VIATQKGTLIVDGPSVAETRALRPGHKASFVFQLKKGGREERIEVTVIIPRYIMDDVFLITYRYDDSTLLMSYNAGGRIGVVVK